MATFTLELQKKPTSAGLYPIFIRITKERKHKRIKTSIALKRLSDWNPKSHKIRTSEPHSEAWNDQLDIELEDAKNTYRDNKEASLNSLAKSIKNKEHSDSFLVFAKDKIQEASANQSIGTYRHYKTTIQKLEEYLASMGVKDVCFNEINLQFVKGFEAFLGKVENQRCNGRKLDS